MIKKQGITITVMVITIIILIILAGTITISMSSTINYSRLSSWATEIMYIQDVVDEQLRISSTTDFTADAILLDVSNVDADTLNEQFSGETISVNNTVQLYKLDLGKLKITNTNYGNLESDTDVYAMSVETGRVYYVQGIELDGKMYYSLTESLKDRYNLTTSGGNLTSVVFVPSKLGYNNEPISVTVKVPNTYANIVISTSNDEIQIGSQVAKEKTYEYTINSNNIVGNYTITVSYNDGVKTLTSQYKVNGYDITAPIINPIVHENFVYREVENKFMLYLINVFATDNYGVKLIKYDIGEVKQENAKEYFTNNGYEISQGKINLDRNTTMYTIYAEDMAGNFSVLTFDTDYKWVANVVDNVPIPKGFVVSPYDDENTKDKGLVIYQLTTEEIEKGVSQLPEETQFISWTTRNQYVWIPVDSNKFYETFIRKDFLNEITEIGTTLGTVNEYWEPLPITEANATNLKYVTTETLAEVQQMYDSVRKYGGFYMGRYEAGVDKRRTINSAIETGEKVYIQMGKIPYNNISWGNSLINEKGGAVESARSICPKTNTNYGGVSTLVYGVQWDRMISWWEETKATDINGIEISIKDSITYSNYYGSEIKSDEFNDNAKYSVYKDNNLGTYQDVTADTTKTGFDVWSLTTGALKRAKVKNIYDTAGNSWEWTMEGYSDSTHAVRGQSFLSTSLSVAKRSNNGNNWSAGFRVALYIKPWYTY